MLVIIILTQPVAFLCAATHVAEKNGGCAKKPESKTLRLLWFDCELTRGNAPRVIRGAGKAWRFGLMGESSRPEYVLAVLSALEGILPRVGYEVASGAAVGAASQILTGG